MEVRDGHSPHGECGLKSCLAASRQRRTGHSPHGECGLKFPHKALERASMPVTPRMGSVD